VEERDARELEVQRDLRDEEVDLDVGAQEELHVAVDVEHGERVTVVRQDVRRHLGEADEAVTVEVVPREVDVDRDAALDAGLDQAEVDAGADGDRRVEGRERQRMAGRVLRVEEEALDQLGRVAGGDELLQAVRVVAEAQVELGAEAAGEGPDERADDREALPVEEAEAELRQRDLDELDRLAEQQVEEDRRVVEDREVDPAVLRDAGGELLGVRRDVAALGGRARQGARQRNVVEVV
jgi:hypothetical protein